MKTKVQLNIRVVRVSKYIHGCYLSMVVYPLKYVF